MRVLLLLAVLGVSTILQAPVRQQEFSDEEIQQWKQERQRDINAECHDGWANTGAGCPRTTVII